MLISLSAAILPWQAVAETASSPLSNAPELATRSLRRGIVTITGNLRASPSMQSDIVAVAKEGLYVEILAETGRWYHVRSEDGVEAWIGKRLVLTAHEPLKAPKARPAAFAQPAITEIPSTLAAKSEGLAESEPVNTPEQQVSSTSSADPIDEGQVPPDMTGIDWFIDVVLSHIQGRGVYVITALVMVLTLSIAFQLRASRQLRRAMLEMGQILDIVEEIYADGGLARTSNGGLAINLRPTEASTYQLPRPAIEFLPIEHGVLEALSDRGEVQEGELGKILTEKGFTGTLIKAVIGDIVRKTGAAGFPWLEVRYVQGRYSYRLRPEALPNLSDRRSER